MVESRTVLIVVCAFVVLVHCKLSPEERLKVEKECVDEVQIDYNIVLNVKRTLEVSDDVKYKQFLNCFYKKQGFKKENGEINFNELKEVLLEHYSSRYADKVLQPCKTINPVDPDDRVVLTLKCIIGNLLQIEIE